MRRKILLVSVNDRCYASYRFFAGQLAEALEKQGCLIGWCRMEPGTQNDKEAWGRAVFQAQSFQAEAVVDFNSFLPKLLGDKDGAEGSNAAFPELFQVPFYNYILDHPLYHHRALQAALPDSRCICVDEEHEVYIKKYYPHVRSVFTCPLPGTAGQNSGTEFAKRKDRILFCGTYEDPDRYWQLMKELPGHRGRKCMNAARRMLEEPTLTLQEVLLQEKAEEAHIPEMMKIYFLADAYVRHMRRTQVLAALARSQQPLDLYGNGWEAFIGKIGKNEWFGKSTAHTSLRVYPALSYGQFVDLVGSYRYGLNVMPGFLRGSHDRITCAFRNGTAVLTDSNFYVREHYLKRGMAAAYELTGLEKLPELCGRLRERTQQTCLMAQRGRRYGDERHTWEGLARRLLEDLDTHTQER